MAARRPELHHAAPRCLVSLHERANGATEITGEGMILERESHRLIYQSDWRRWGTRGGRETLRRYGAEWFSLLALRRWGRITAAELEAARVLR